MTPYTPDAIKYVRQHSMLPATAIAEHLGWDLATLRARAQKHGIELSAANPMAEVKAELAPTPEPAATVGRSGLKPIPIDANLHQVIASLPPRQADVLTVLSQLPPGTYLSGTQIVRALHETIAAQNINDIVGRVRRRLLETRRWRIESLPRRGGGHRLVDLQAGP